MRQAACDESQRGGNSARAMAEELFKLRDNKKREKLLIPFLILFKKRSKKDDPDSIGKLMYGKFAATKSNIR
jgi:hypothetical protein